MGKKICLRTLPIRFSKNIFLPCHFLRYVFYGLLAKVLPKSRLRDTLLNRNPYFRTLYETDIVADITGGDSFSDIYGFRRFFFGFLCKWLVIFLGKKLILLPQTYGPFKKRITKMMAKHILNHASLVYSRDQAGIEHVNAMLNNQQKEKVRFAPDVAFVLDPRRPDNHEINSLEKIKSSSETLVGLNISGLLFNRGYDRNNMFGLKVDYRNLIYEIINLLTCEEKAVILLVPHVFPPPGFEVESDSSVCSQVYMNLKEKSGSRVFLMPGRYNHNEIKYVIGMCDFFVGSRMHTCIAALSQGIATVGLAYTKKFRGVFETVGAEQCVVDMCNFDIRQALATISDAFEKRSVITQQLISVMPVVQQKILSIFDGIPDK
jgi:polysaccharide pyruvyl transferase WcaK-like protein